MKLRRREDKVKNYKTQKMFAGVGVRITNNSINNSVVI